jgi:uncharacterized protein with HEPN domain
VRRSVSRRYLLYLRDMAAACRRVLEFGRGLTRQEFCSHGMAYYAIVRNLEIIGEAVKGIPQKVREQHPEVEWARIARTRDIIAHHYFALEDETLWEIAQVHAPRLLEQVAPMISEMERTNDA